MMEDMTWNLILGQVFSLIGLGLCLAGFSSKRDDRLLVLLISANVAFAIHFVLFESWTAAALTVLVVVRIFLARKYPGNLKVMFGLLVLSVIAAALTWRTMVDVFPLLAMTLATLGMFLCRGIPLRIMLGLAAFAWMMNNILIGSIGGTITEGLILVTNVITIFRIARAQRRGLLPSGS